MKKILSVAIASTFTAIALAQGTPAAFAGDSACTVDSCVVHTHNTTNSLGEKCTLNEIILNYLKSTGKFNSCIDLEKLQQILSDLKSDGCINNIFGGNCEGEEKPEENIPEIPDNNGGETEKPEIQFPEFNFPDFNFPDFIVPDDGSQDESKPDIEKPENTPDTDKPGDTPTVPDTEEKPEENIPEVEVPDNTPSIPDVEQKPDVPENDNQGGNTEEKPNVGGQYSAYISEIVELVNKERTKNGLSRVTATNSALSKAAAKRAMEQAELFSHTRPDGSQWSTVLSEYGVSYGSAGENVAYGQRTPSEVMSAWMSSQGHRENILNGNYKEIGVGVYYKNGTYYWSQLFIS